MSAPLTVSLVSHGHASLLSPMLATLLADPLVGCVVLTLNVPERIDLLEKNDGIEPAKLLLRRNKKPLGFGENHNQAFAYCQTPYFVVINPDVILAPDTFESLIAWQQRTLAAIVAPQVFAPDGKRQDSWRRFPTIANLVMKALGHDPSLIKPDPDAHFVYPDWVAGMCMLFKRDAYQQLGGFDERYHLYYEDVDICARAWLSGFTVLACQRSKIVHDARRASRRQWRHMRWHARSLIRYLWKYKGSLSNIVKPPSVERC